MARRTIVELVDDIDGSEASESVTFGLDGTTFEIDLTAEHAQALRDGMAQFVSVARQAVVATTRRVVRHATSNGHTASHGVDPAVIRQWARDNGYGVSERGRVSSTVIAAYHSGTPAPPLVTAEAPVEAVVAEPEAVAEVVPARRRRSSKPKQQVA